MGFREPIFKDISDSFVGTQDPYLQRQLVLRAIDNAPFGWPQIRASIVAGVGFLTSSYQIFAISLVIEILAFVYAGEHGKIGRQDETLIKLSTTIGILIGQLFFGWLADLVGRKRMYGLELSIVIVAVLVLCFSSESASMGITGPMVLWRVLMGIGIGGDYPLSSVITSEFAMKRRRGAMIATVFSMQGFGQVTASLVSLVTTLAFRKSLGPGVSHATRKRAADRVWRIVIGFGAVPGCAALYFRLTIPETPRYTFDVQRDVEQAYANTEAWIEGRIGPTQSEGDVAEDRKPRQEQLRRQRDGGLSDEQVPMQRWSDFVSYFREWQNAKVLIGTSISWLLLDVGYYGMQLNSPAFLKGAEFLAVEGEPIYEVLKKNAIGNLVIVGSGAIPGYLCSIFLIDIIGRRPIQLGGFAVLTVLFWIIGYGYDKISRGGKLGIYILCQFFFNFGPNTTTFVIPGECFVTRYRTTASGVAAASGKIGAIIAQNVIGSLKSANGEDRLDSVLQIYSWFLFVGFFFTFLVPETKGQALEDFGRKDAEHSSNLFFSRVFGSGLTSRLAEVFGYR